MFIVGVSELKRIVFDLKRDARTVRLHLLTQAQGAIKMENSAIDSM